MAHNNPSTYFKRQSVRRPCWLSGKKPLTLVAALRRHTSGDWGEVDPDDRAANDDALRSGERLLSVYQLATGTTFWVLTEADRSATTVLLPDDY